MFKSDLASTLYLLLGSVFVLLFIACVNVSSLLLARAVNREHEFVVRASIGASRMRLVAHCADGVAAARLDGVAGGARLARGWACRRFCASCPADTIPDEAVVTMNVPVLLGSLGLSLATVLIFGLAPAWHSANPRLAAALSGSRTAGNRTQRRLLSGFVVTEIALSLALLVLAGLMVRSLLAVENVPVPFAPDRTLMMRIPLPDVRYPTPESRSIFFRECCSIACASSRVCSTATVDAALPLMDIYGDRVQIGGQPEDKRIVAIHLTDPAFLAASGRKMLQGHFIDAREVSAQAHEAVITENFAKTILRRVRMSIGRTVRLPDFKPDGMNKLADNAFTVVGVMSDLPPFIGFRENYPHIFLALHGGAAAADA